MREVPVRVQEILKARIDGPLRSIYRRYTQNDLVAPQTAFINATHFNKFLCEFNIVPRLIHKSESNGVFFHILSSGTFKHRASGTITLLDFVFSLWFLAKSAHNAGSLATGSDSPESIILGLRDYCLLPLCFVPF